MINKSGAFITLCENIAYEQAKDGLSALAGVPFALADNICTEGILTTCASKALENFVPPYDSAVVEKLRNAKAVLLGKVKIGEFGIGSEGADFPAIAVADDEAAFVLASDTGGLLRKSAPKHGVVYLKPTYGGVSRYGLCAFASSMDQVGPVAKTAADCAAVMNVVAGKDSRDSTSTGYEFEGFDEFIGRDIAGMKVGVVKGYPAETSAAKLFEKLGAVIVEVSIPSLSDAINAQYIISSAEASSNLARFDGVRFGHRADSFDDLQDMYKKSRAEGFGGEVQRRVMFGSYVLSSEKYDYYFKKAQQIRALISAEIKTAFGSCDLILAPITDAFTAAVDLAGTPSMSLPWAKSSGIQLIGPAYGERTIIQAACAIEAASAKGE